MDASNVARGTQQVALREWTAFFEKCVRQRISEEKFETFVPFYQSDHPLPPAVIADLILKPQPHNNHTLDPRVPLYVQTLARLKCVDTPSILKALYKYSTSHTQSQPAYEGLDPAGDVLRWQSSYAYEDYFFYNLTKAVAHGTAIRSPRDALEVSKIVAKWMDLFTAASTAFAADVMGSLENAGAREEMESARAAFVALLLRVLENDMVLKTLGKPGAKDTRKALSQSLASFVPTISDASQIATRLELFRTETLAGFEPVDKKDQAANAEMEELLDATVGLESFVLPDIIVPNSRAGLYIYLNACLVGRPLIDDAALFNYLQNRYQGDIQTTTIDLILASFDVLANAVFRNEGQKAAHLLRSYLINKLPLLLAALSASMYPPLTPEFCITNALGEVDTNAFPTLSSMFDDTRNNNPFTDSVREDFLFACCLHDLVPESSIETLLGENTYQTLPESGRHHKDDLVQQCVSDTDRLQWLIGEIDKMDGNVGAVCQALTEVCSQVKCLKTW
jgi:mediator of RNA polymerase II transcription subunit 5